MKEIFFIFAAFISMFCVNKVNAQVTFPSGTNLCETTPWKLVWYDEFNGTSIDNNKWFTFSDDGNWAPNGTIYVPPVTVLARKGNMVNFQDANVTVSNGSCKLSAIYEPNNFMGSYKNFSSGYIKARRNQGGSSYLQYFNRGKFEIRAKLPKVKNVWAVFWLWTGGASTEGPGGTEIDMFEYMPGSTGELNENTFTLHGWNRGPGWPVSPNSTGDKEIFSINNIDSWHVYTCEWDENFVRLFVDGVLKFTKDRYKLSNGIGYYGTGDCVPNSGLTYYKDPQVTATFPYPDELLSLICSMDYRSELEWTVGEPTRVFEIDYIRVYQRTPQSDLHDVCGIISGPTQICANNINTTYTYSGDAIALGGMWQVSPNLSIVSSTSNSVTVKRTYATSDGATISIANPSMYCPSNSLSIITGGPSAAASVQSTYTAGHYNNQLSIVNIAPNSTYNWSIRTATPNTWVSKTGANVSVVSNYTPLCFWVSATNSCGTDYMEYGGCLLKPAPDNKTPLVFQQIPTHTNGISSDGGIEDGAIKANLYPNPATNTLNLELQEFPYVDGDIQVKILDINNKVVSSEEHKYSKTLKLNITGLANGVYWVSIQKEGYSILKKFVKK